MTDGIDFSDEGLMAAAAEAEAVVEDTPPPVEEPAADPVAEEEPAAEPEVDWQARYEEAQKLIGRQGNELGELRKAVEGIQAAQNQPRQEAPAPARTEQIISAVEHDPHGAFQYALMNAPDQVPAVIAQIRIEHGDLMAEQANAAYAELVAEARAMQMVEQLRGEVAPLQERSQYQEMEQTAASAATEFLDSIDRSELEVLLPAMQAELASEWKDIIESNPTPAVMKRALRAAYLAAKDVNAEALAQARAAAVEMDAADKRRGAAEGGTPGKTPEPTTAEQEAERIAAGIFAQTASVQDLFKGFS